MTWLTAIQSGDDSNQDRLTAIRSAGGAVGSSGWSSNLLRFARRTHIGVELKLIEVFVIEVFVIRVMG